MSQYTYGLLLILVAMMLEATGQLCFKKCAHHNNHGTHPLGVIKSSLQNHWMICGVGCFFVDAAIWTIALTKLPLSIAFPAGSVCFVFVALLSAMFLKEQVGRQRWIGIGLILAGVILVSLRIP